MTRIYHGHTTTIGNADLDAIIATAASEAVARATNDAATLASALAGILPTLLTNGLRINPAAAYAGVGTATLGGPRVTLGFNTPIAPQDDSAFLICRGLVGVSLFSHAVRDESTFSSLLDSAYCSYDSIATMSGGTAYNHLRSFQSRIIYTGSGTLGMLNALQCNLQHTGTGVVALVRGVHYMDPGGTGPITQNVAIYVDPLTRGTSNYALYSQGAATPSYHAGFFQFGNGIQVDAGSAHIAGGIQGQCQTATGAVDAYNSGGGVVMQYVGGGAAQLRPYANNGGTGGVSMSVNINGTDAVVFNGGGLLLPSGSAFYVNSVQVVNARKTGYTAMTGTPDKATAFATSTVTLAQLAGRVMQLQADLTTHGLIGA